MSPYLLSIVLLILSTSIMTVAWYAHLRFAHLPLWQVILGSWLIAFFEYCFQVPANRIGHTVMPAAQLRVLAEFFTLVSFIIFSVTYLKEPFSPNFLISFGLIFLAVYFAFYGPFK